MRFIKKKKINKFFKNKVTFDICKGDRIAQLILEKIITPEITIVDDLDNTKRNTGGFGSTGI